MFVPSMRNEIESSHKMPQPFSKAWAVKLLRLGLGRRGSYNEQCDREAKIAQAGSWLSQAITKGHSFSLRCSPDKPVNNPKQ
jgi:hypothetical protein